MIERRTHEEVLRNAIRVVLDEMTAHQAGILARYLESQLTSASSNLRWRTPEETKADLEKNHRARATRAASRHLEYRRILDELRGELAWHLAGLQAT